MAATSASLLWNQRTALVQSSPEPLVRAGETSSTRLKVPPSTAANSLPPGPPSGFAKREQPCGSTHSTTNSRRRVPAGAVKLVLTSDLKASGQSLAVGVGWQEMNGAPSTAPSASVADSV